MLEDLANYALQCIWIMLDRNSMKFNKTISAA